jgi:DNA-binding MarR family transcriptional regulator
VPADADVASLYSHAEPIVGARPNRASAVPIKILFMDHLLSQWTEREICAHRGGLSTRDPRNPDLQDATTSGDRSTPACRVELHNSLDNCCLGIYIGCMTPPRAADTTLPEELSVRSKHGIIRLVNRVRIELIDAMDRELAQFDITAPQLIVLASVANREADSASQLCKSISYDPGAMTRMIDRLEQKGLVRRVPRPDDRRAMTLEMTAAGKALYPQLLAVKESVQARFLRGFTKDEVAGLEKLLNRLLDNR